MNNPETNPPLLSLIIPIYNEDRILTEVLKRVRAMPYPNKELILVDDCSSDDTREILKKEEKYLDTTVIYHKQNQGKGASIRSGFEQARGEIIIIQDADLEYDPQEIPRVIEPILAGKTQVCYGSRFIGKIENMHLANRLANYLLAWLVNILYGSSITDEATAYKAFRRAVIEKLNLECRGFEFCPEVTAKVLRLGYRIIEVPVTFYARTSFEGKKIGWRDFFIAVKVLLKWRFTKIK